MVRGLWMTPIKGAVIIGCRSQKEQVGGLDCGADLPVSESPLLAPRLWFST